MMLFAVLLLTCTFPVSAADSGTPYSPAAHAFDRACGGVHDAFFGLAQRLMRQNEIPAKDDFMRAEHPQFYPGTEETVHGDGWYGGFADESIIPQMWRMNAHRQPDPEGWRIRGLHGTGGYQWALGNIFTDQRLRLMLLSCGSDANRNGIADILLFISFDGVGITGQTMHKMREAVEQSLTPYGVTTGDIIACTISATHCHNALDTQGMYIPQILKCLPRALMHAAPRSIEPEMEQALTAQAASCASKAYDRMEPGTLSYYETPPVDGAGDRLESGVRLKNWFSGFLFEGESGKTTVLANLAAHPVSYSENYGGILYADYPYFMAQALEEAGVHLVFTQSAQASIRTPSLNIDPDSARDREADDYVFAHTLSKADWQARYGKLFAAVFYRLSSGYGQADFDDHIKTAYLLARHILDALPAADPLAPSLRVKNMLFPLDLDNGLLALGSISGILGEYVMQSDTAESGYAVAVELGLIELGRVAVLTAPGELSPALLLGSDPDYTGDARWTGVTSWTGEEWPYDPLETIVRKAYGDNEKTVLLFGLSNGAIGYVYPDECVTQSVAGALFYKHDGDKFTNNMLFTTGGTSGSQLICAYTELLESLD